MENNTSVQERGELFIEDITVLNAGKKNQIALPQGYERIEGDLNEGAGGDYLYFIVKKGPNRANAINGLAVVEGTDCDVNAPDGYDKINMDLNTGAGGKYIYLCTRRGREGAIHDVKVVSGSKASIQVPAGYQMIAQDLNEKAGGKYIYLCYM